MHVKKSAEPEGVALVFGSSGGIGGALVKQLERTRRFEEVRSFARSGSPSFDLTQEETIQNAALVLSKQKKTPRLIFVATGFLHDEIYTPEKSLQQIEASHLIRAFAVNVVGPALIAKHFIPLLPRSGKSMFAVLSARVGSIGDNRLGGWYSYRASKAALNQFLRTVAIELKRTRPAAICVALHPGTVDTPLSRPFKKVGLGVQAPSAVAAQLVNVMSNLTLESSGGFIDFQGSPVPW